MNIQQNVKAFSNLETPFQKIAYANRHLADIARAVHATGQSADQAFRSCGCILPKPLPELIDEQVDALPKIKRTIYAN